MTMPLHSRAAILALALCACLAAHGVVSSAQGAGTLDLDAATIADLNAAFDAGTLTSEALVKMCLARIEAYDEQGPRLNAVLAINPAALDTARALDAERRAKGRRSPLHGIPVVLKDNIDTADMPTTGGSVLLEGSIPPDDAFVVKRLREAGAVILAKVNLSELAAGGAYSSLGGQTLNPHDLSRSPSGSSSGTGVAVAAAYATLGLGTDTGGSVRGPSAANGIVGLKPTLGLVSRDGIIPLALSFDTAGPMARSVYDVAAALSVLAGPDAADAATAASKGQVTADYTAGLSPDALRGARIGLARDFMGADEDVDWIVERAAETMQRAGATVVDVRYPEWLLQAKEGFYTAIRHPEFPKQLATYLATLGPDYPKSLDEMIAKAKRVVARHPGGGGPNPSRWMLFEREAASGPMSAFTYTSVRDHGLPLVRAVVDGLLAANTLDAIVYPTSPRRAGLLTGGGNDGARRVPSATNIANLTGYPDLSVPAGFTGNGLPVNISFFGPAFSEARLLALGHAFEQATHARRLPVTTPLLSDERITRGAPERRR